MKVRKTAASNEVSRADKLYPPEPGTMLFHGFSKVSSALEQIFKAGFVGDSHPK